jgi:hypothetical protein
VASVPIGLSLIRVGMPLTYYPSCQQSANGRSSYGGIGPAELRMRHRSLTAAAAEQREILVTAESARPAAWHAPMLHVASSRVCWRAPTYTCVHGLRGVGHDFRPASRTRPEGAVPRDQSMVSRRPGIQALVWRSCWAWSRQPGRSAAVPDGKVYAAVGGPARRQLRSCLSYWLSVSSNGVHSIGSLSI